MRNKLALFIGLFLLISLFTGCTTSNTPRNLGESDVKAEFVLNKSLPEVPEEVMSYRIAQPVVSIDSVANLGSKFGFMGEAGPIEPLAIGMSNEKTQEILQVNVNSGTIEYSCLSELFPLSPSLPDNTEAVKIATEFLVSVGLWHPDLVADEVTVGGTSEGKPSHLLVRFTRYVDGIPFTGPGNKFAVRIGDEGKVVRLLVRYSEIEQDKAVQTIDPDVAFSSLKAGNGIFVLPADCKTVVINNVTIGYYLETINEKQEYLIPFYIFSGECRDLKGGFIEEFTGWVKATVK
jgi:hypothetical protein